MPTYLQLIREEEGAILKIQDEFKKIIKEYNRMSSQDDQKKKEKANDQMDKKKEKANVSILEERKERNFLT